MAKRKSPKKVKKQKSHPWRICPAGEHLVDLDQKDMADAELNISLT